MTTIAKQPYGDLPTGIPRGNPSPAGGGYGSSLGFSLTKPRYIPFETTESAANNAIAQGLQEGDQRYQMKKTDRQGFSRSAGSQFMAAQAGQQEIQKGADAAAGIRSEDQLANSKMRADYQQMQDQLAESSRMADWSRQQSKWSVDFANRQSLVDMLKAALTNPAGLQYLQQMQQQ